MNHRVEETIIDQNCKKDFLKNLKIVRIPSKYIECNEKRQSHICNI